MMRREWPVADPLTASKYSLLELCARRALQLYNHGPAGGRGSDDLFCYCHSPAGGL